MRLVERHPTRRLPTLERTPERDRRFAEWITNEVDFHISSRRDLEETWRVANRQYEGVPRQRVRNSPILNAPNIEVTIGATATDSVYAAAIDAIFTANPLLICRANADRWVDHSKTFQKWSNWVAANEVRLRQAVNKAFMDCCKLGSAAFYIPYVQRVKKTDIHKIIHSGPIIIPIGPENLFLPHHSTGDIQNDRWIAIRFYYTPGEVEDRARQSQGKWDIRNAMPIAHVDQTRSRRLDAARLRTGAPWREMFEFLNIWCSFDYDEDGEEEDLFAVVDRTSRSPIAIGYNGYDIRPIETMCYQERAHMPYGMGVMEMMAPYEEEATELHNHRILNSMLSNARMWAAKRGSCDMDETSEIWPGKVILTDEDPNTCITPLQMSDVYPQLATFEAATLGLAEQRVGLRGELSMMARGGSRTPATTALSLLQQANRRFTPAFDSMRLATAAAMRQAHWRYSERVKVNEARTLNLIREVMGEVDAALVEELYRQDNFERAVQVELTAASATVSRESDRQNSLLLANFLRQYYQDLMQGIMLATAEGTPDEVRKVAIKTSQGLSELIDRTIRTFDQVRDPSTFVVDVTEELEGAGGQGGNGLDQLTSLLGGATLGLEPPLPITGGVS